MSLSHCQWLCPRSCLPIRRSISSSPHNCWCQHWPCWAPCHYPTIRLLKVVQDSVRIDLPISRGICLFAREWPSTRCSQRLCGRRKRQCRHLSPWLRGRRRWVSRWRGWWTRMFCHLDLWRIRCWWSCQDSITIVCLWWGLHDRDLVRGRTTAVQKSPATIDRKIEESYGEEDSQASRLLIFACLRRL